MKKLILKVHVPDDKAKQKALKVVSAISGIESLSIDVKDQKLTVIGDIDPVQVVGKLRKLMHADILSVGPKEEKKGDDKKPKEESKDEKNKAQEELIKAWEAYYKNPYPGYPMYVVPQDDFHNPNSCVIC